LEIDTLIIITRLKQPKEMSDFGFQHYRGLSINQSTIIECPNRGYDFLLMLRHVWQRLKDLIF